MAKILGPLCLLALVGCSLLLRYSGAATGAAVGSLAGPGGAAAGGAAGAIAGDAAYAEYFADGRLPSDDDELTWGQAKSIFEAASQADENLKKWLRYGLLALGAYLLWNEAHKQKLRNPRGTPPPD